MGDHSELHDIVSHLADARVVLYGDLVLDRYILGSPKRVSREAPVIILRWEGERNVPGGGANALANLAALGAVVRPVGMVGDDEPGEALLEALASRGIDTELILTVPGYSTTTKVRILGGGPSSLKHQVARYDVEGAPPPADRWRSELLARLRAAVEDADAVAVSDYGYGVVLSDGLDLVNDLDHRPEWVCLDSRYRLRELRGVDAATPNLGELAAFAGDTLDGDDAVARAAETLRRHLDARFLLATRGNNGMTLVEEDQRPVHIPVFGTDQVADVTGAGDTVLAALTAALAAGAEPAQAARLANVAAGCVVMKQGTATVSAAELTSAAADKDLQC